MINDLGLRLKIARQGQKLSQTELAERVGINQNNIAQYEAGRVLPKLETIVKFSRELGCGIEWLITGDEGHTKTDEETKSNYDMVASYSPSGTIDVSTFEKMITDLETNYRDQINLLKEQLSKAEEEKSKFINILENVVLVKHRVTEYCAAVVVDFTIWKHNIWFTTDSVTRRLT